MEGNVAYGEKITLTCTATGKPPFEFTWVYNDVETHVNNSKFTIDSMDETNEGEYKCKVSNEVGFTISEPITLKPGRTLSNTVYCSCKLHMGIQHIAQCTCIIISSFYVHAQCDKPAYT